MSDVTADVEALAEVIHATEWGAWSADAHPDHNRWTWRGEERRDMDAETARVQASAVLDALPDLLRADSPAGDALRERLRLAWDERHKIILYPRNHPRPLPAPKLLTRRLVSEWDPPDPLGLGDLAAKTAERERRSQRRRNRG